MAPPPTVDMYVNKKNLFIVEGSSTYYAPMSACHSHLTYCPMKAVDPYGLYNGQMYRIETIYSETDEYIYAEMLSFADGWSGTVIDMDTVELSGITYKRQIPSIYLDITGQWQDGWLRPSIMNEGSEEFDEFLDYISGLDSWEDGLAIIEAIPIYQFIGYMKSPDFEYKELVDKYEFNLPDDSDELIFIYVTEDVELQPPYDNNKLGILINPLYYVGLKQEQNTPDTPPSEPIVVLPQISTLEINGKDFNFRDKRGYTKSEFDFLLQQVREDYNNLPQNKTYKLDLSNIEIGGSHIVKLTIDGIENSISVAKEYDISEGANVVLYHYCADPIKLKSYTDSIKGKFSNTPITSVTNMSTHREFTLTFTMPNEDVLYVYSSGSGII